MGRPCCMGSSADVCMEECDSNVWKKISQGECLTKEREVMPGSAWPGKCQWKEGVRIHRWLFLVCLRELWLEYVPCCAGAPSHRGLSCLLPVCVLWLGKRRVKSFGGWLETWVVLSGLWLPGEWKVPSTVEEEMEMKSCHGMELKGRGVMLWNSVTQAGSSPRLEESLSSPSGIKRSPSYPSLKADPPPPCL